MRTKNNRPIIKQNRAKQPEGKKKTSVCSLRLSTCVNAQRVEVLHVAHGDAVIGHVSHDLILHLFPAQQGLLHQDLAAHGQSLHRTLSV